MDSKLRKKATIAAALASAVAAATPVTLFSSLAHAQAITDTVRTYCRLDDGRQIIVIERRQSVNALEVFGRDDRTGEATFLPDGEYRLDNGYRFEVIEGLVNADWLAGDSGGFQQYHQGKDPWTDTAYPAPTPDETDRIRFTDAEGRQFLVVQRGLGAPYQAYILDEEGRGTVAPEGEYGSGDPWGTPIRIRREGEIDQRSIAAMKLAAYEE